MFYSTFVLQKKGPFAKVWIAAHWDKKLSKTDIKLVDISETVVNIVKPAVPIALRTSGELMLGVVIIYSHKVRFLLKDAQDATVRIRTFDFVNTSKIDLPRNKKAAALFAAIEANEDEDAPPAGDTMFSLPNRVFGEPPQLGAHLGDLDEWFQVPSDEPSFQESQQEAFFPLLSQPIGQAGRQPAPSETSSVVSSTGKLRMAGAPERRAEPDVSVDVPVEELDIFAQMEPPEAMQEAPLPAPMEVETPGRAVFEEAPAEAVPEKVARPKKRVPVVIDKEVILSSAAIKRRLEDTSDIVRPAQGDMERREMEIKAYEALPIADRFAMPMGCTGLSGLLAEAWQRCVQPATPSEGIPDEDAMLLEGRSSMAPPEGHLGVGDEPVPAPFEMEGGPEPPPAGVEMGDIPTPPAERKRKAEEATEARKRARAAPTDLSKTVHETLSHLKTQLEGRATLQFGPLVQFQPRRVVATRFYDLLVLKNKGLIDVHQPAPLQEITITPTVHFESGLR